MSFQIGAVATAMVGAARGSLADKWPKVRQFAEPEFRRLARSLSDIAKLAADSKISATEAKSLLRIHRNTVLTVMLTVEGLGVLAAEQAINSALKAGADAVNAALPFKLL